MENDTESEIIKGLGDLKKQLNSLKRKIATLSNTVSCLDNLGLQQQIVNQNEEIKKLQDSLVTTKRRVANLIMNFHQSHLCNMINKQLSSPIRESLIQKVRIEYTRVNTSLSTSNEPLTLAGKFKDWCIQVSEKHNLNAYF